MTRWQCMCQQCRRTWWDSIRAAQPDFTWFHEFRESRCQSWRCVSSQASLVPVPSCTMQKEVAHVEKQEMPVMSQPFDDGFRAGLRLLHAPTRRWRSALCLLEHGLDFQGSKGDLLNRLLRHFARAPLPTPTQDLVVACGFWFSTMLERWQVDAGGTSVKGSNVWQTCYAWWVMTLFSLTVCFQVAIFVRLEWFLKRTWEGLLYLYLLSWSLLPILSRVILNV